MVTIDIQYEGQLRCRAEHGPSGDTLKTDAPIDNHGKGEAFSPTDLVATALGSCMATVMGITAERKGVDLTGTEIHVEKEMSADTPRRIAQLGIRIRIPLSEDHSDRKLIENTALTCPVLQSLHPDVAKPVAFEWVG